MQRFSQCREIDQLVRGLVRQGWDYWRGSKHGRLAHPSGGPTLTVPGSPSDYRAVRNFIRDLKHAINGTAQQRVYQN